MISANYVQGRGKFTIYVSSTCTVLMYDVQKSSGRGLIIILVYYESAYCRKMTSNYIQ